MWTKQYFSHFKQYGSILNPVLISDIISSSLCDYVLILDMDFWWEVINNGLLSDHILFKILFIIF